MDTMEQDRRWYSDEFLSSLMLALALHVLVFLIAFVFGKLLVGIFGRDNSALEIVSASVRVDVVGMPKLTLEELRKLELPAAGQSAGQSLKKAQAPVDEPAGDVVKEKDLIIPSKDEKTVKKPSLTSFLQDYSQKKIPKVSKVAGKAEGSAKLEGLESLILEGNKISKGTALTGTTSDLADSAYVGYVQTLPDQVRQHWRLPSYLKEQAQLKCRVHVWIGSSGDIIRLQVRESSGHSEFDEFAQQAVRAAAPFSAPPVEVAQKLTSQGVVLGFPL